MTWARARNRLIVALIAASVVVVPSARAQNCGLCGDVNGDGFADIVDALFCAQTTVGLRAGLECPGFSDVDQSGGTDIVDCLFIAQFTVGLRPQLGCPRAVSFSIDSPEPLAVFASSPIEVKGTVSGEAAVVCNSVEVQREESTFSVTVPLKSAENVITCLATSVDGTVASASVSVTLDNVSPVVVIDSPRDGLETSEQRIDVTGVVNDVLSGFGVPPPEVRLGATRCDVSNRTFICPGIALLRGPNSLAAVATDSVGNSGQSAPVRVTRRDLAGQRIRIGSGNNQTGPVSTELAEALVVELVDSQGAGVAGRSITFRVTRGSGTLTGAAASGQTVTATSDAAGRAEARFTLGANAGEGSHRVTASAVGFVGEAVFCASASTAAPDRIVVISGSNQTGAVSEMLPLPLIAAVLDLEGNPVSGVPVTFSVVAGDGSLSGQSERVATTGPDGRAAASLRLGPNPGVNSNRVQARFSGLSGLAAIFTATSVAPGRAGDTSISGVVLDNSDLVIPGVTASVPGTSLSAIADDQGRFTITGVPVGPTRLFIDGSTATRDGLWPDLEFALVTVAGQDNTVGMPIRLPLLDEGSSKIVGGDEDVTLTMADVPGVALTVFKNSASFADGSTIGRITVTQVHLDKVPMPPPNGSQFALAWTIQPPGVHFSPPARISIPNNGMPPGMLIDMFSFDHDLGMFVPIGTASVSADGSIVQSDPGFGVEETGWGGCTPPPPPPRCLAKCGPCETCDDGRCAADVGKNGQRCADTQQSFSSNGVKIQIGDGCQGSCNNGSCEPGSSRRGVQTVRTATEDALSKIFDSCMGDPVRSTMQNALRSQGFFIECIDGDDTNGDGRPDCASAAVGGNSTTISNLGVGPCGSLAKTIRHEMQHGAGNRGHTADPADDTVYACDLACYGRSNRAGARAENCK
jgi:hypothetical protein